MNRPRIVSAAARQTQSHVFSAYSCSFSVRVFSNWGGVNVTRFARDATGVVRHLLNSESSPSSCELGVLVWAEGIGLSPVSQSPIGESSTDVSTCELESYSQKIRHHFGQPIAHRFAGL